MSCQESVPGSNVTQIMAKLHVRNTQMHATRCSRAQHHAVTCMAVFASTRQGSALNSLSSIVTLQVGSEVGTHLKESGVEVKDYTALLADIKTLASSHTKLWADPAKVCSSSSCITRDLAVHR